MSGADLMHPLAVRPAPHILAGHDDRTAQFADLSRSVRLVVAKRRVLVLVTHAVFLSWAAEIFQQSLFNFAASEVRRGCHGAPPGCVAMQLPATSFASAGVIRARWAWFPFAAIAVPGLALLIAVLAGAQLGYRLTRR